MTSFAVRRAARLAAALVVSVGTLLSGCATYTDHIAKASLAASSGSYAAAVEQVNSVLAVSSADSLPDRWRGDRPVAALERGVLQQALGQYGGSARDLSAAEQELELLDLKTDPVGALGSYLYSDSVKTYKTPPTERLALNAVNLLNYLARGDLDGAAVEARRFQVMREYLASEQIDASAPATLGNYLAGFVFEQRGEGDRALRYYDEALASGPLASLTAPVVHLARTNPYRGTHLSQLLAGAAGGKNEAGQQGDLLVVLNVGRVPHREPRRMPLGAAIGIAGTLFTGDLDVLKYSVTKVIVYPELVDTPSSLGPASVRVDGGSVEVEQLTDFGSAIRTEYEQAKPKIIAAALTRLAARAAVAEGIRAGGEQESALLGDLLSILFESTLVALDRPDTRSWTMLPERVLVARLRVTPGPHTVEVSFSGGGWRTIPVDVQNDGYAAVVVTEPR
jgi:tetratricopeptide (TPR) repeat protein